MASRPDRPYSAKSRLESSQPLTTSPPVSRLLTRSQSQSTADARRHKSSITRAQALGDSAKTHSSPSKTRGLRPTVPEVRPESAPQRRGMSLSFASLLAALLLLFWQLLVALVLSLALHSIQQVSSQIAEQGEPHLLFHESKSQIEDHKSQASCMQLSLRPSMQLVYVILMQTICLLGCNLQDLRPRCSC